MSSSKPKISKAIRIRHKEHFKIGKYSIVDDYCYFSTKVTLGKFCHIAPGCTIAGGKDYQFTMEDFGSLSSGVKIWCSSNDFTNDLIVLKPEGKSIGDKPISGDVKIGKMCGIGANSVIMPNNVIPDGTVIGALSFVPSGFKFKEWSVYAGVPIRFIKKRNKANVLRQAKRLESVV